MLEKPSAEKSDKKKRNALFGMALLAGVGTSGNADAEQSEKGLPDYETLKKELLQDPQYQKMKEEADRLRAHEKGGARKRLELDIQVDGSTTIHKEQESEFIPNK